MLGRSVLLLSAALGLVPESAHATCFDHARDGPESDVDCGGDCVPCSEADRCTTARDCYSGRCAEGRCEEQAYLRGEPVPAGYHVDGSEADRAATIRTVGWVSLGLGYGGAYAAALALPGEVSWLYFPVLGPWVEVADGSQSLRALIAVDALLQTVGAGLVIGGIAARGRQLVRDDAGIAALHFTPAADRHGGSLLVWGAF